MIFPCPEVLYFAHTHADLLAKQGFSVFICDIFKQPCTKLAPHGYLSATNNIDEINMWEVDPQYLAAIACKASRIIVFDCEVTKAINGEKAFEDLLGSHGIFLLSGPIIRTPSGGRQFYYSVPESFNYTGGFSGLPDGVTIIYDGYVMAPECVLPDGTSYQLHGSLKNIPLLPYSLQSMLMDTSACSLRNKKEVQWHGEHLRTYRKELVKGLLPKVGVGFIAGQSGAGKTFISLCLAACVGTESPFFGHIVPEPVGTLLLLGEGADTVAERLRAITENDSATAQYINKASLPIAAYPLDIPLSEDSAKADLRLKINSVAAEMKERYGLPLGLIIIDTLASTFAMDDENDAGLATQIMKWLQLVSREMNVLVLAVTHYGKSSDAGVRGSSAYTASADAILAVQSEKNSHGEVTSRSLSLTKSRWRDTGWKCAFTLRSVIVDEDEDGSFVESAYVSMDTPENIHGSLIKKRISNARTLLLQVYEKIALTTAESIGPPSDSEIKVQAIRVNALRAEFIRCYPADGATEANRADTKRKQFKRAFEATVFDKLLLVERLHDEEWVWRPS